MHRALPPVAALLVLVACLLAAPSARADGLDGLVPIFPRDVREARQLPEAAEAVAEAVAEPERRAVEALRPHRVAADDDAEASAGELAAIAVAGSLLLVASMGCAWMARRPAPARVPRWTLEAGRALAARRDPRSMEEALAWVARGRVGKLRRSGVLPDGTLLIEVRRRRRHPCARTRGFVQALFERAWADAAVVAHAGCAGRAGVCIYRVRRGRPGLERLTSDDARATEASTRG